MSGRYDFRRSAVALLAAFLAGAGVYAAVARLPAVAWADTAVFFLGGEMAVGLALALWPIRCGPGAGR